MSFYPISFIYDEYLFGKLEDHFREREIVFIQFTQYSGCWLSATASTTWTGQRSQLRHIKINNIIVPIPLVWLLFTNTLTTWCLFRKLPMIIQYYTNVYTYSLPKAGVKNLTAGLHRKHRIKLVMFKCVHQHRYDLQINDCQPHDINCRKGFNMAR